MAGALAKLVDVRKLQPYEGNARTHPKAQLEQITASIRRFGFYAPVGYDEKGLAFGHGRQIAVLAMWEAGETVMGPGKRDALPKWKVPGVDITGLSEDERRALIIADNQIALNAGWDESKLAADLRKLMDAGMEASAIGFESDDEIMRRLRKAEAQANPPAPEKPPADPVTKPGDLWQLGRHRLLCGDATKIDIVKRLAGDDALGMLISDPPYGIGFEYKDHDDSDADANADLVEAVFALAPKAKCWTPGKMNLERDLSRFGKAHELCWYKRFAAAGNGIGGASTWEPILVVDPLQKKLANDHLDIPTDRVELEGKQLVEHHPCPKPVALYEQLIEAFVPVRSIVYEPFSGSGTTLIAGELTGRAVYGLEIDPAYVDVAVKRWQTMTGDEARLDGKSFAQVAKARGVEILKFEA